MAKKAKTPIVTTPALLQTIPEKRRQERAKFRQGLAARLENFVATAKTDSGMKTVGTWRVSARPKMTDHLPAELRERIGVKEKELTVYGWDETGRTWWAFDVDTMRFYTAASRYEAVGVVFSSEDWWGRFAARVEQRRLSIRGER